jgi:hypothetical protein
LTVAVGVILWFWQLLATEFIAAFGFPLTVTCLDAITVLHEPAGPIMVKPMV